MAIVPLRIRRPRKHMIIRRLKEKCRPEEKRLITEHRSSAKWGTWPEMFMIEEEIKI
jgi:hypothetical protein